MSLVIHIIRAIIVMALLGWFSATNLQERAQQSVRGGLMCLSCLTHKLDPELNRHSLIPPPSDKKP